MYKQLVLTDKELRNILGLMMNHAEFTAEYDLLILKLCDAINELEADMDRATRDGFAELDSKKVELDDIFMQIHDQVTNK